MEKTSKFKIYFSKILVDKYHLNRNGIDEYWKNKEKQERFDNKKFIGTLVGLGELIGAASLCFVDQITDTNLIIPIVVLGGIGTLTTKISVTRKNPYSLKRYRRIDEDYKNEKIKYKHLSK